MLESNLSWFSTNLFEYFRKVYLPPHPLHMHCSTAVCPHPPAWRRQQAREVTAQIVAAMAMSAGVTILEPMGEEATIQVDLAQCNTLHSQHSTPPGMMSKTTSTVQG